MKHFKLTYHYVLQGGVFSQSHGSAGAGKLSSALYDFNLSPSSHSPLIPISPRIGSGSYDVSTPITLR